MTAIENQKKAVIQAIEAETDSPVADDGAGELIPIIPMGLRSRLSILRSSRKPPNRSGTRRPRLKIS